MGLAPPELGQFDGWESSGEEERERWGWCRRSRSSSSSRRGRRLPRKGGEEDAGVATGCCIRLWPMGNCPPQPRSKVDTSTSSASTHGGNVSLAVLLSMFAVDAMHACPSWSWPILVC